MKRILLILILTLNFQSWTKADDIREFEIEGISIGDSLLDFFSEGEIKKMSKSFYPKSKKYTMLTYNSLDKFDLFNGLTFHVQENDKRYIIHVISGQIWFENELSQCLNKKKEIVKDLNSMFKNLEKHDYDFKYEIDDGKSIAYITDFDFEDNSSIRIWCVNWSKIVEEEKNFTDNLSLAISPNYFLEWLNTASP